VFNCRSYYKENNTSISYIRSLIKIRRTKKNYAEGRFIAVLLRLVITKADNFWDFLSLEDWKTTSP
jgi:hypothetical protein